MKAIDQSQSLGDAPIEARTHDIMNAIADGIDGVLNGDKRGSQREWGFVLLVFPFHGADGRANYISNARREDIVVLLKEQLARFEGQPEMTGTA